MQPQPIVFLYSVEFDEDHEINTLEVGLARMLL